MNFVLQTPSLKRIVSVKIATELWVNDIAIRNEITVVQSKYKFAEDSDKDFEKFKDWQDIECQVLGKVPSLSLPNALIKHISGFIRPIGIEIRRWMDFHNVYSEDLNLSLPKQLFWTVQGSVDWEKIAEVLVKDEEISVGRRYRLACVYCLEDEIHALWKRLLQRGKFQIHDHLRLTNGGCNYLIAIWTATLINSVPLSSTDQVRERSSQTHSPNLWAFRRAFSSGNQPGTKYFFEKLTREEKDHVLVEYAEEADYFHRFRDLSQANVVCFLLSQMSEEQQVRQFEKRSADVLHCLLVWPWQPLFMETVRRGYCWRFMSHNDFGQLLQWINVKNDRGFKDYDYEELLREFWQQSPVNFKNFALAVQADLIVGNSLKF